MELERQPAIEIALQGPATSSNNKQQQAATSHHKWQQQHATTGKWNEALNSTPKDVFKPKDDLGGVTTSEGEAGATKHARAHTRGVATRKSEALRDKKHERERMARA